MEKKNVPNAIPIVGPCPPKLGANVPTALPERGKNKKSIPLVGPGVGKRQYKKPKKSNPRAKIAPKMHQKSIRNPIKINEKSRIYKKI